MLLSGDNSGLSKIYPEGKFEQSVFESKVESFRLRLSVNWSEHI